MELERLREKKRVFGKGRIALIAAIPLIGLFLAFAISNLGFCEEQMSEGIIRKSPLVWRVDEDGDYLLPQMSANETYELTSPIKSEGRIKTITATWEFKGEVSLEVSANNGVDYTPVVNGTPLLILDASSGNQLRWKTVLGLESELTEVRITYTDTKDVLSTFGSSQLSGFKFRKLLYISNLSGRELFNYQLKIKVGESAGVVSFDAHCDGNIQADFKDVRFTAADGETPLSYYLENTIEDTPICSATYYVRIPQLPKEGLSIYLYYANPDARDISDAESVFDFFDDFGGELDSAKWDSQTNFEGECCLSNSFLKLDAAKIISKSYQFKDGIIEYRAKAEVGYEIRAIIREDKEKIDHTQLVYSSVYEGAEHSVAVGDIVKANALNPLLQAVFYDFRIIAQGTNLSFERYSLGYNELETSVSFQDTGGLTKGCIGLEVGGIGSGENIAYYDWLRIRKFAEAEPYISASGEEEEISLAKFSNTTVADDGDVVLDSTEGLYSLSGRYTTAPLSTACNITAIIPTIKRGLAPFSIDISADGGASWREDCVSGKTYSAPFDFTAGRELLLRANLSTEDTNTTSELKELKLDYSITPIVTSANTRCWGATGEGGVYISGDAIIVEWDNSSRGDNNPDILSVSCNFELFGGDAQTRMSDDDNDSIYTVRYELPEGIKTTSNIFVTVANFCGVATRDGHILSADTMTEDREQKVEDREQETEEAEAVLLEEIVEKRRRPGTTLYDLLIKLGDNHNSDPVEDARACYKEGDIVLVRLTGHSWSKTERSSFLIVQAYLTDEEVQQLTRPKEEVTGEVDESGRPVRRMLRRRAKRIDLNKLGLSEEEGQKGRPTGKRAQKLRAIRSGLKGKALRRGLIEEKEIIEVEPR